MRTRPLPQWITTGLLALVVLLMLGHLLVYINYAVGLMRFPFDYDQGEGFELVDTIMFSEGDWPYRSNEAYPFYASNYPPLFHIILVPFVWIFGPAYWYGRLAGFVGTLITAAALAFMVYRSERHRTAAIVSGLAFLASNYVYHVGPLFRQHMSMVMFETLAVLTLAHVTDIENPRRRRWTMLGGLALLLAAGYTKQHAVATAAAVFVFLFIRRPRLSIIWGIGFGAVAGAIFLAINIATHGAWWDNIIAANVNPYIATQFTDLFKQWFRLHGALIVLAALFAIYEFYFTRLSLYTIWWIFAVLATTLAGKWGAGDSYFATSIAATCLLAGLFAARTLRGSWSFPADHPYVRRLPQKFIIDHRVQSVALSGLIMPIFYLYYGLSVIHMPTEGKIFGPLSDALGLESSYPGRYAFYDSAGWVQGYATIGHVPTQQDIDNGWHIVDILRFSTKPAMSEEAGFSLQADKDVVTNPTQLKNLYENDLYDPTNLIHALAQHDFSVIIFRAQFYPPPVLDAVYEAYYPAETVRMNGFDYEIWHPGPPQDIRQSVAAALETPSSNSVQSVDFPLEQTQLWLEHALWYHNWKVNTPLMVSRDCLAGTYQRDLQTLTIELCSTEEGVEITLRE